MASPPSFTKLMSQETPFPQDKTKQLQSLSNPDTSNPSSSEIEATLAFLEDARQHHEDSAIHLVAERRRWATIAGITLVAVIRAAAEGDPTCLEALRKVSPILPKSQKYTDPILKVVELLSGGSKT